MGGKKSDRHYYSKGGIKAKTKMFRLFYKKIGVGRGGVGSWHNTTILSPLC